MTYKKKKKTNSTYPADVLRARCICLLEKYFYQTYLALERRVCSAKIHALFGLCESTDLWSKYAIAILNDNRSTDFRQTVTSANLRPTEVITFASEAIRWEKQVPFTYFIWSLYFSFSFANLNQGNSHWTESRWSLVTPHTNSYQNYIKKKKNYRRAYQYRHNAF